MNSRFWKTESAVPRYQCLPILLLGGDQFHELAEFSPQVAPTALDVLYQRLCFVLCQHGNLANTRVDAIRQYEIYDPKLAAERRRRFTAVLGERLESLAPPSGHHDRQRPARQAADVSSGVIAGGVSHTFPVCC
jgi:hypothetical protein